MSVPKKKRSRAKTRRTRSHNKVATKLLASCPQCQSKTPAHKTCIKCGYYKSKPDPKKLKREERAKRNQTKHE